MNQFFARYQIGDRVTYMGFRGTICSSAIFGQVPDGARFYCYLVEFDKTNSALGKKQLLFQNSELCYSSTIATINEKFLERIV